ncbi:L-selectin-like isoform X2 [Polypterus senegalus]|uniref:L-selectin-like isoform X2 n=1 Tax=Polypterus senegalus TaxID=55291 RepID=UPI0019628A2C|nr:L-selectin-like isoform X2 [Polypterus senegalus]
MNSFHRLSRWINMMGSILIILAGFRLFVLPVHGSQEFNYHYVKEPMNWTNAQAYCKSNFTDLVTIADEKELQEILNNLTRENVSDAEIWIGLKDINMNNGTWSNGETSTYRKWNAGEPNNRMLACGSMYYHRNEVNHNGTWNDCGCQNPQSFICYAGSTVLLAPGPASILHHAPGGRNPTQLCHPSSSLPLVGVQKSCGLFCGILQVLIEYHKVDGENDICLLAY